MIKINVIGARTAINPGEYTYSLWGSYNLQNRGFIEEFVNERAHTFVNAHGYNHVVIQVMRADGQSANDFSTYILEDMEVPQPPILKTGGRRVY